MRRLRRLIQKRSLRWSERVCILEGPDLVVAALSAGEEFEGIYIDGARAGDSALAALITSAIERGVRVTELEPGVIEKIADAQSPQPILAAVRFTPVALEGLSPSGLVVVLHEVRDPGNAGTMIRTADAAGASAVVCSGQSVDPYNPKTLRASAGSIFHLPVIVEPELPRVTEWFRRSEGTSFATVVHGGVDFRTATLAPDALVVFGNESEGLDAAAVEGCEQRLSVPMSGRNESLNVSAACAVVLFESLNQRQRNASAS